MPDRLQYRFAQPDEIEAAARLAAHSFPGVRPSPESYQAQLRDPAYGSALPTLFLGLEDARPVAALQLHTLRQWLAGEALPVAGVGTVSIAPTHRRRGVAAELMAAALRAAKERGDVASALYPFRAAFYRRCGYGMAGEALQYLSPAAALPDSPERSRVELLEDGAGLAAALALYQRWAATQTGQLVRNQRLWADRLAQAPRTVAGYRAASGELEGYALVTYRTELPPPERYLEVDELVWTTPAARAGLLAWLGSLSDQWSRVLLRGLPEQHLGDLLGEVRLPHGAAPSWSLWVPAATLLHGPMFRILDMPGAWARRRVRAGTSLAVSLHVQDAQLPENEGPWRLELADGCASLAQGSGGDVLLRCDVATLSRLYIGALDARGALETGLLECDRSERLDELDAALRVPQPWMFDRF